MPLFCAETLCMCVHVCVFMCVQMYVNECACGSQGTALGVVPQMLFILKKIFFYIYFMYCGGGAHVRVRDNLGELVFSYYVSLGK